MQQKWSEADIKTAIKMRKNGSPIFDIAKEIGRTYRAVEKQLHRRGIKLEQQFQTDEDFLSVEKNRIATKVKDKFVKNLLKGRAGTQLVIDELAKLVPQIQYENPKLKLGIRQHFDEEILVLELSDLHIGRTTNSYNIRVFKERMEMVADRVIRLVTLFRAGRNIKKLYIFGLGDWVDGDAIFPGQPFEIEGSKMKQIFLWGLPSISKFLGEIAPHFKEIKIFCVKGNHGRNTKFDAQEVNWDLILYELLKESTKQIKNISWDITWEWYQIVKIFNWKFLLIHGDQIRMWMNLPFYGMTQKGMRWQGSIKERWDYLNLGHFHTPINFVWNNFEVIANGTFLSGDDWAQRELGMNSE